MRKLRNNGFTIIELLIATVIFSVILLIITSAIIQFSKIYYKGVISSRVQESSRNVINDVSSAVQFSGTATLTKVAPTPPTNVGYMCIGSKRYTFRYGIQVTSTQHVLVTDSPSSCGGPFGPMAGTLPAGASELLSEGMQLINIDVSAASGSTTLYNVALHVAYGANTDFATPAKDECKVIIQGGQFCAITKLNTTVAKRID